VDALNRELNDTRAAAALKEQSLSDTIAERDDAVRGLQPSLPPLTQPRPTASASATSATPPWSRPSSTASGARDERYAALETGQGPERAGARREVRRPETAKAQLEGELTGNIEALTAS
jgi:hypothetical protein